MRHGSLSPTLAGPVLVCCLTPCVGALGAARFGRRLQRSLAGVWRVRLHVWLLIVVVRIGENAVLLHCPAGHHFLTDAETPPLFSVARSVSNPILFSKSEAGIKTEVWGLNRVLRYKCALSSLRNTVPERTDPCSPNDARLKDSHEHLWSRMLFWQAVRGKWWALIPSYNLSSFALSSVMLVSS